MDKGTNEPNDPYLDAVRAAQREADQAVAAMNLAVERWEKKVCAAHERGGWTLTELAQVLSISVHRVEQIMKRARR